LAYRGQIGRAERGEPTPDTAAVREHVTRTGEAVVIDDVTRDKRIADAPLTVQSLVMVPLKFGDQVIGTLELEHHKRRVYRSKDVVTINTFANQLATAIHITELRRPLVETVETLTQQLATLVRAAESMREAAAAVAQSTGTIRQGVLAEQGEVTGGLEATESLAQVSRRVSEDGTEAAQASTTASEVANRNRHQIRDAIGRLVEQSASAALEAGELVQDVHRQVGEVIEQMRRGQVNVGGVEELSSAALQALDAIVAATAEATSHAQRIAAAAGDQDKAFGKLRDRIHAVAAIAGKNRADAAARGLTELEPATKQLEDVAAMLRQLTRGFASVA